MTRRIALAEGAPSGDRLVLGLAAALIVVGAVGADDQVTEATDRTVDQLAVALLVVGGAIVVAGGRRPAAAAVAVLALTFAWYAVGYRSGLVNVVAMAAFYRLGTSDAERAKVAVTSGAVVATGFMMLVVGDESVLDTATATGYLVMAVLFGELLRSRGLLVGHYASRAARAEAEAERRVTEERLRIARDLHDVLAHTVSVMTVQAGVAAEAIERNPDDARRSLAAIRRAGRTAMREVRATVAVLRAGGTPGGTAPAPGIDGIPDLVAAVRDHGLDARLETHLDDETLPEVIGLTAFRVVQEGLTNVVRHSGASSVLVRVHQRGPTVVVEVRDDGSGGDGTPPGLGLRGMAERVGSLGGSLHHGRDGRAGWTVRASLPVEAGR